MNKKRFIIEVEEGDTKCGYSCPLSCPHTWRACGRFGVNCELYDLTTMIIIEESNNQ
jgi:hypothetical protein